MSDLAPWLQTDILTLGMAADDARRRAGGHGAVVTYLRVQTTTAADLVRGDSIPDEAAEVRLHDLPASCEEAVAQVSRLRGLAASRLVAAYSMAAIEARARSGWGELHEVLGQLVGAGLSDVAELPIDELEDLGASVRALQASGITPRRLTVSHPVGDARLELLERASRCLGAAGCPRYLAPLPRRAPADKPTTGYDDLRMVALARLAIARLGDRQSPFRVEVDWSLYGPKLAQVALTFGADHLDAVPATSDATLGPRRATVRDIEQQIRAAGFHPEEQRLLP